MEEHIYLGVKKFVVCINKQTGEEVWRTAVKSSELITLVVDGPLVIAHARGVLFGISRHDGRILWQNGLTGLGYGHCIIATEGSSSAAQTQHAAASIIAKNRAKNRANND